MSPLLYYTVPNCLTLAHDYGRMGALLLIASADQAPNGLSDIVTMGDGLHLGTS